MQVGVYFDFTYTSISNPNNGANDTACVFTGVGGYIGVSAGVKMAWYTILPVVFIPAYFGIDISGNVLGFFGAGTDTSQPKITYDAANNATVNFDDKLGEFHASVKMAATVQVYVGVGLAGTIGLRGGGTFSAMGLWEPSDLVSDWGGDLVFTAGIWIDLFLFSVPLQYSFPDIKIGSFEEYANLSNQVRMLGDADAPAEFEVRRPYTDAPSEWLPEGAQTRSAFSAVSTQTIVQNAYEHPDVQLLKLKNGSVFMAFLDTDPSREAAERTVLKYAVYQNGTWSSPYVVQDDETADFQPSICEMDGGKVMISWLSSDPDHTAAEDSSEYLSKLEVYTAVIDPASKTVSDETQLTTDEYFDYTPTSVYDEATGDRVVYYVKTAQKGSAAEMANSYANDCVIVYMLYSHEKGKWMFDEYYPNEVDSPESEKFLIDHWHGQRFLSSPIPELGKDVPNIADFTAISYNGIAVYAYTIDQDSSNDTAFDKELFIQCYNFETHTTYVPIRITNDSVSDALPQFVRTGESFNAAAKTDAATKLFWYRDEKEIAYIDISSLVRDGVNDDGTIKQEYLTSAGDDREVKDIDSLYSYVSAAVDNPQGSRSMADFKAVTDGDDLYIVWTQPVSTLETDADGNYRQCREVYATALVQDENAVSPKELAEGESADESGASWADPYRLTCTNAFTDEPNAVIDANGNLMVLYNSYNQTLTGDAQNPVEISDFKLNASYMEPCGAVEVTSITFSNGTPNPGEPVTVTAAVKNAGLTAANGYTVNIYEMRGSVPGSPVTTIESTGRLLPGNTNEHTFEWTAPASVNGVSFYAEAKEGGMNNTSTFESEKLEEKPVYDVDDLSVYQDENGFHLTCNVTNNGNVAGAADDTLDVIFSGPYAMAADYTLAECDFGKGSLTGIGVGESKALTIDLKTIPEAFNEYGFLDCLVIARDKDGKYLTDGADIRLVPSQPLEVLLNGKPFPKEIVLSPDETMDFEITCEPKIFADGMKTTFGTDDTVVAVFDGATLKALSGGTTTVHGAIMPYGAALPEISVRVTGESSAPSRPSRRPSGGSTQQAASAEPEPEAEPAAPSGTAPQSVDISRLTDVRTSDWFYNSVAYVVGKGYFTGTSASSFSPNTNVTRGMLVTVLGRLDGISEANTVTNFSDVASHMYYAAHIAWASEKGIVSGYGADRFGPDDEVTREQLAVMIANFLTYKTGITGSDTALDYMDAEKISDWAKASVALATQQGILSGNGHGGFEPQKHATRAEIAVVIEKLDQLLAEQESSTEGGNS